MTDDFDYKSVPNTFLHCVNTHCIRAKECMRQKIMYYVPKELHRISIVNPAHIPEKETDCTYFFPDRTARFAQGITHLLDEVPHTIAVEIRNEMYAYFKRNTYYRIRSKERLIKPAEQEFIRRLFIAKGIKEGPVFDEYQDLYDWLL